MVTMVDGAVRAPVRYSGLARYVLARYRHNRLELLRVSLESGEEALPVFSCEKAAREFLPPEPEGNGWYARECFTGELISLLYGPYVKVRQILLDPPPDTSVVDASAGLVGRETYLSALSGG